MDARIQSQLFYALRGSAIISVAYAHSLSFSNEILQRIAATIGIIGVPIFLFCSGFYHKHLPWRIFTEKLTTGIALPWLIWGTLAFGLSHLLGAVDFRLSSFLAFIVGHGTWLYYIPVYLLIRILFNIGNWGNNFVFLLTMIVVTLASVMVSFTPPRYLAVVGEYLTPWQNPLNWVGYFSLGILFKKYDLLFTIKRLNKGWHFVVFTIFALSVLGLIYTDLKVNYWNPFGVIMNFAIIALIPFLTGLHKSGMMVILGRYSYLIYLLHMQIAIAAANIIYRLIHVPDVIVLISKPLVVIAVTMLIICGLKFVLAKLRLGGVCEYMGFPSDVSK